MSEELIDATLRNLFIFVWLCSLIPAGLFASAPNLVTEKMEIEFLAYRLHQFESVGKIYGSKSWKVLYEAVSINESVLRKCMVLKWKDLIGMDLESKFSGQIGAVLVIIPSNFAGLTAKDKQAFFAIEQQLASIRTDLAIYFTHDSPSIQYLLRNVAMTSGKATTALQQLLNSMVADNYQISSTNSATTNTVTAKVYNVIAQLNAAERGLPHLYIVAHYDTFGIIPALAEGSDSNGSGIAVLLELLNIFSQLYALPSHRARFNLVFVLSAGGKFSYQGSRDFAERHSEESISLAICLDGLAKSGPLQVHVSKAPNSGSSASKFISILNDFSPNNQTIEMVVKKINLAAERLAWEHEIYNIRRIHGFTLSHFKNPHDPERNSLLDTFNTLDISALEQNTKLIANSLVAFVFDLNSKHCQSSRESGMECGVLNDAIRVDPQRLRTWLKMFASKPRPIVVSQQQLVSNLYEVVKRYSHNAYTAEVDINDFLLYDIIEDTMTANIVKPAIFELILAAAICTYLYGIYYLSLHAQPILEGTVTRIKKLI